MTDAVKDNKKKKEKKAVEDEEKGMQRKRKTSERRRGEGRRNVSYQESSLLASRSFIQVFPAKRASSP